MRVAMALKLKPCTTTDGLAMAFTIIMVPVAYLHGVFNIAPVVYAGEEQLTSYYLVVGFMTFLLLNTVVNYWLLLTVDTSCRRVATPVVAQPGWIHCPLCQLNTPPRSHHCPICGSCILRRDHHCYFAGKCVGYHNHRYFVSFLIHVTTAALLGVVMSFRAVCIMAGGFRLTLIPGFVFPILAWVLQMMPVNPFTMLEASIALFASLGAGALLGLQLYQAYRGQTYWEYQRNVTTYRKSFAATMREIMGKNWWVCWLCPLIPSPLPYDGSEYQPRTQSISATNSHHLTHASNPQNKLRKKLHC